ncbi:MAG TPA: VTT domain-containing protein [Anaerolineae bacterium]|nr:VTT domain-containing protein [Anaerolineae bacterium]
MAIILVPFFLFGEQIETWTESFLESASNQSTWVALVLGSLLATDILVPVPSSLTSTAAGFFLGLAGGTATSLAGMTVSCVVGYWLGARFGRPVANRLVGEQELARLEKLSQRFGDWVIVVTRAVPVLAEASALFAGISGMPMHQFLLLSTLSNLGISAVYAAVGAFSATVNSFLFAFGGSILVPLVAMILTKSRQNH